MYLTTSCNQTVAITTGISLQSSTALYYPNSMNCYLAVTVPTNYKVVAVFRYVRQSYINLADAETFQFVYLHIIIIKEFIDTNWWYSFCSTKEVIWGHITSLVQHSKGFFYHLISVLPYRFLPLHLLNSSIMENFKNIGTFINQSLELRTEEFLSMCSFTIELLFPWFMYIFLRSFFFITN